MIAWDSEEPNDQDDSKMIQLDYVHG
jgi:hypothetical protein